MTPRALGRPLLAFGFALLSLPAASEAGWHARQVSRGDPAGPTAGEASDMFYQDGKLRIDQGKRASMVLHMRTGRLTLIDHEAKRYIDDSVEARLKQQREMLDALKSKRAELPPAQQKRFDEELARIEKGTPPPKPQPTGKKEKVGPWTCELHTIRSGQMEGEVCLARDVGVKLEEFAKDAKIFAGMMQKLGGQPPGSQLMLEVAERGFPVRTRQKVRMGPEQPWIEGSSEVEVFEAMQVPASHFEVPAGYERRELPGAGRPPR